VGFIKETVPDASAKYWDLTEKGVNSVEVKAALNPYAPIFRLQPLPIKLLGGTLKL
jgi:hypothetical protein